MGNSGQDNALTREERKLATWIGSSLLLFALFPVLASFSATFQTGQPGVGLLFFCLGAAMAAVGGGAVRGAMTGRRNELCVWALKLGGERD